MSTERPPGSPGAEKPAGTGPQQAEPLSDRPAEQQESAASAAQATDPGGDVTASREVPEPDSLGG